MKKYALIAVGILASSSLAAVAETNQSQLMTLSPAQMDGITAGMIQLPAPSAAITAAAEAIGRVVMTGTSTNALVRGSNSPVQFGFGRNWIIAQNAISTATGDVSRSTSFNSSDDTNGTTPLGQTIRQTRTVGPTQFTGYSSVQPTGLLAHNLLARGRGLFW